MNFDRFRWPLIIWVSYHLTEFFFFKFKTYHYFIIFQNFWISAHRALTLQAQSRFWKRVHTEIYKFYQNFIIWLSCFLLKNTLIIWVSYHMSELFFSRLRRGFIIWLSYHMTELRLYCNFMITFSLHFNYQFMVQMGGSLVSDSILHPERLMIMTMSR